MRTSRRKHRADWDHRRNRNYERDRALQAFRNAAFILVIGFLALGLAFANAWSK
jgi:hypothetical protein